MKNDSKPEKDLREDSIEELDEKMILSFLVEEVLSPKNSKE